MSSIFEKIVSREIPSYIVYEDDLVMAFLDIQQATLGHTLVITKVCYPDLYSVPSDVLGHLFMVSQKIAMGLKLAFNPKGINIVNNNGHIAGQTVFHFHVHLLPRYDEDQFSINFVSNYGKVSAEEYENRANALKLALL